MGKRDGVGVGGGSGGGWGGGGGGAGGGVPRRMGMENVAGLMNDG